MTTASERVPVTAPPRGGRSGPLLLALAVVAAVANVLVGSLADEWSTPVNTLVFFISLVALIAASAVSLRTSGQETNGRLLAIIAILSALADICANWAAFGPWLFLEGIVYAYVVATYGHLLLRWPHERIRSALHRAVLWVGYLLLPALVLASNLTWRPAWYSGEFRAAWWLTIVPARELSIGLYNVGQALTAVFVVVFLVLILIRVVRADPIGRRRLLPVAAAAVLIALTNLLGLVFATGGTWVGLVQNLGVLTVPVAVLVALFRQRSAVSAR